MTAAYQDKDIGIGGKRGSAPVDIGWEITSPPEFESMLNRNVMVPMRDGVKLATDIYFPASNGKALPGPWQVVFERSAYDKTLFYTNTPLPEYYAERGYVFIVQDSRGCFCSEGVFNVYTEIGGKLNAYLGYTATPGRRTPVHVVIGGGEHDNAYWRHTHAGDVDFGASLPIDLRALMMQWFDRYLKGADTGVNTGNRFRAFRIDGGNGTRNAAGKLQAGGTWQEFAEWPPRDAKPTKFYLSVDRMLAATVPVSAQITYRYDPADPVPSVGGNLTSGAEQIPAGPYDQRGRKALPQCRNDLPLNARPDVISFMTPPLETDIEVTGPVAVNLWVSSSAVDTDFTAKLIDQYPPTPDYPEGYAMNLQDSIVRARLRSHTQFVPHARRLF